MQYNNAAASLLSNEYTAKTYKSSIKSFNSDLIPYFVCVSSGFKYSNMTLIRPPFGSCSTGLSQEKVQTPEWGDRLCKALRWSEQDPVALTVK